MALNPKRKKRQGWRGAPLLLVVAAWMMTVGATGAEVVAAAPWRVALMNFSVFDNSFRSMRAAEAFTTALQTQLSDVPGVEWVERADLEKAESELRLPSFGLINRAEALRSGRWVKADWAVFGEVLTNTTGTRVLALEVVDLHRADVLADTRLELSVGADGAFRLTSADLDHAAVALRAVVRQATGVAVASREHPAIALLFLRRTGPSDLVPDLQETFQRSLESSPELTNRFHVLRLRRPGEAMDEAALVLSGLVETDPDAWQKVADIYLWGSYSPSQNPTFDPASGTWKPHLSVGFNLHVWDGRGEPRVITNSASAPEDSASLAKLLVGAVEPLLLRTNVAPVIPDARRNISDSVLSATLEATKANPTQGSLVSLEGRRAWLDIVEMAEAACFFNPGNVAAREFWLDTRWGAGVRSSARSDFVFTRQRSDAWGKFVDQFGVRPAMRQLPAWTAKTNVSREYLMSAWQAYDVVKMSHFNRAITGVPMDMAREDIDAWVVQAGAEFARRLATAFDEAMVTPAEARAFFYGLLDGGASGFYIKDAALRTRLVDLVWRRSLPAAGTPPWQLDEAYLPTLAANFAEAGQPGGEQKLLAQLAAALTNSAAPAPKPRTVKLPRISILDPSESADVFDLPPMVFPPPGITTTAKEFPFPHGVRIKNTVIAMVWQGGRLWFTAETQEAVQVSGDAGRLDRQMEPVQNWVVRLWSLDPAEQSPRLVEGILATNRVNGLTAAGDHVWLALEGGGIADLDPAKGTLRAYDTNSGLTSLSQNAVAEAGNRMFAIDNTTGLQELEDRTWHSVTVPNQALGIRSTMGGMLRRLTGAGHSLVLYNLALLAYDVRSNRWSRLDNRFPAAFPDDNLLHPTLMTRGGASDIWIRIHNGLHHVDAETGEVWSQFPPLPLTIAGNAPDSSARAGGNRSARRPVAQLLPEVLKRMAWRRQTLSAARTNSTVVNLLTTPTRLSGVIFDVTEDGDFVWVLSGGGSAFSYRLLLLHWPTRRWVAEMPLPQHLHIEGLAVSPNEVWLGAVRGPDRLILRFPKEAFLQVARERWVPAEVPKEDVQTRLATWTPHQQALYHVFAGNHATAINLLQAEVQSEPPAESLFLLALVHDELGAAQPDKARAYADQLIASHPESVLAAALQFERRSPRSVPPGVRSPVQPTTPP